MKTARIAQIVAGIVILSILLFSVGIQEILKTVAQVNLDYFFAALVFYGLTLILGTLSIFYLLKGITKKITFGQVFKSHILSSSIGLLFPGKVGEASLVYYLKKDKVQLGKGSSVFIVNKAITTLVMCMLAVIGAGVYIGTTMAIKLGALVFTLAIIGGVIVSTTWAKNIVKKILGKHATKFQGIITTTKTFWGKNRKWAMMNVIATILRWFARGMLIWCLFKGLGVTIGVMAILLVLALETLVAVIPITINGLGTKHAVAVYVYQGLFSILPEITLGRLILGHVIRYGVAGIALLSIKKK